MMMTRTQIQLTEEQTRSLKREAAERGISISALVREAIDQKLAENEREARHRRALSVVGKFHDREGKTDVSERHDDYLAEALEEEMRDKWHRPS